MVDLDWDERYQGQAEQRPWDSGTVDAELMRVFSQLDPKPESALEIGCGTGTNALWLARQGATVVATDLAPTAIDAAVTKQRGEKLELEFRVHDILKDCPVPAQSIDFVFDRGVFHVMSPEQRPIFVDHLSKALNQDGWWLCLAGSADETKPPDKGPPRLTAAEILAATEDKFELHSMNRYAFELPGGSEYLAWRILFRKRHTPA